ncbi:MAG: hypothetical protein BJ554DRAFT_7895 [Olpidium bornovanus]|uniref:PH domain-containing protein n=1 Tax=Olpidium bornovanus TaxID=278681 RepID=A0A8H8DJ02_9FUNG|nr:MAG: hypothetical protein BJ554DRAFT_7895 [Olpidium bornovanus]
MLSKQDWRERAHLIVKAVLSEIRVHDVLDDKAKGVSCMLEVEVPAGAGSQGPDPAVYVVAAPTPEAKAAWLESYRILAQGREVLEKELDQKIHVINIGIPDRLDVSASFAADYDSPSDESGPPSTPPPSASAKQDSKASLLGRYVTAEETVLRRELERMRAAAQAQRSQIAAEKARIDVLAQQVEVASGDLERERRSHREAKDAAQQMLDARGADLAARTARVAELELALTAASAARDDEEGEWNRRLAASEAASKEAEKLAVGQAARIAALDGDVKDAAEKLRSQREECEAEKARASLLRRELAAAAEKLRGEALGREGDRRRIAELERERAAASGELAVERASRARAQVRTAELELELRGRDGLLADLTPRVARLEGALSSAEAARDAKEKELQEARGRALQAEQLERTLEIALAASRSDCDEHLGRIRDLECRATENQKLQRRVNDLTTANDCLRGELRQRAEQYEAGLRAARAEADRRMSLVEEALATDLSGTSIEVSKLKTDASRLSEQLAAEEAEKESLRAERDAYAAELSASTLHSEAELRCSQDILRRERRRADLLRQQCALLNRREAEKGGSGGALLREVNRLRGREKQKLVEAGCRAQRRIALLHADLRDSRRELGLARKQADRSQKRAAELACSADLRVRIETLEEQLRGKDAELDARRSELQAQAASRKEEQQAERDRRDRLQSQIESLQGAMAQQAAEAARATDFLVRIETLEEQLRGKDEQLDERRSELQAARSETARRKEELQLERDGRNRLQNQILTLQEALATSEASNRAAAAAAAGVAKEGEGPAAQHRANGFGGGGGGGGTANAACQTGARKSRSRADDGRAKYFEQLWRGESAALQTFVSSLAEALGVEEPQGPARSAEERCLALVEKAQSLARGRAEQAAGGASARAPPAAQTLDFVQEVPVRRGADGGRLRPDADAPSRPRALFAPAEGDDDDDDDRAPTRAAKTGRARPGMRYDDDDDDGGGCGDESGSGSARGTGGGEEPSRAAALRRVSGLERELAAAKAHAAGCRARALDAAAAAARAERSRSRAAARNEREAAALRDELRGLRARLAPLARERDEARRGAELAGIESEALRDRAAAAEADAAAARAGAARRAELAAKECRARLAGKDAQLASCARRCDALELAVKRYRQRLALAEEKEQEEQEQEEEESLSRRR